MESRYIKALSGPQAALFLAIAFLQVSSANGAASPPADPSFVSATANGVAFIAWTESSGGSLTGQFQIATATRESPQGRMRIETHNLSFSGLRNGQSISLTFSEFFITKTLTGTVKGKTLTLTLPAENGLLSTIEMHEGTVEDYNRAVIALQKRISAANALVDQREAVVQAHNALETILTNELPADLDRVQQVSDFADVIGDFKSLWDDVQRDNAQLLSDSAVAPFTCTQLGTVQTDLGVLETDRGILETRTSIFDSRSGDLLSAVAAVRGDLTSMQRAEQELRRAVQADTTKILSQKEVDQLRDRVQSGTKAANEKIRSALAILRQAENEAREYTEKVTGLLEKQRKYVASLTCHD